MSDQSQGNVSPQDTQDADAPKYVTEEQLNKAITARFGEFTKKSNTLLEDKLSGFEKKLVELLPKQPEPGTQSAPDAKSVLDHPEVKGMAKKLQDLEERARKAEEQTAAEKMRARDIAKRQFLAESLGAAGVKDPIRLKHAVRSVLDDVEENEMGDGYVWKSKDGAVDFGTGLDGWKKTDDAKIYLTSPDAQTPPARAQQQRVSPNGVAPQNTDDLDFDSKLALTRQQLSRAGSGLT